MTWLTWSLLSALFATEPTSQGSTVVNRDNLVALSSLVRSARIQRMNTDDVSRGWHALESQLQVKEFMALFGNFHDACVREMHAVTGHYVAESLSMTVDW